ncbi:hypothetical protein FBU30_005621 [Linnemannia zychae]|nr:hypothetical protein FBU30_005621 [Linnemannia zychae]
MRATKSVFLATLFVALVQAQQRADQASLNANPWSTSTESNDSNPEAGQPQQGAPELTTEEVQMAKEGLRQILSQVPMHYVEPLVNTVDSYCSSFEILCNITCKDHLLDEPTASENILSFNCANPKALTIGTAKASCQCGGQDMTERINFAILGGIVAMHDKKGDFGAEGILDTVQFLPSVPTFISIIHVLQTICYYVSFLDILATNPNASTCSSNHDKIDGVLGTITKLLPGLVGILPGAQAPGDLLGGLFGTGGKASTPTPTPTPASSSGSGLNDLWNGIFGGGANLSTNTTATLTTTLASEPTSKPTTTLPTIATTATTSTTTKSPSPTSKTGGGLFGLFGDEDNGGHLVVTNDGVKNGEGENVENGITNVDTEERVNNDGRVSRAVRAQRRYSERLSREQDQEDRRNDL